MEVEVESGEQVEVVDEEGLRKEMLEGTAWQRTRKSIHESQLREESY